VARDGGGAPAVLLFPVPGRAHHARRRRRRLERAGPFGFG
jgi:hypothetical protein